jgi:DNA-directed RNA polymerase subunit RPC12/RpoP
MSFDAQCPHCGEEFDVEDRYESGEFNCPECYKRVWIEVDYTVTYEAQCMPQDHQWKHLRIVAGETIEVCEKCRKVRFKSENNEVHS